MTPANRERRGMQISHEELAGVDPPLRELLRCHESAVCSMLVKAGRQGWYRWRAVTDRTGKPVFDLVADENPSRRLARLTPNDLALSSTELARVVWERLN
jgi:hypothetical protein